MKIDILAGPGPNQVSIINRETQEEIPCKKLRITYEVNEVPTVELTLDALSLTVDGKELDAEIEGIYIASVEHAAKQAGFKLVPDDDLDRELGRDTGSGS